MSNDLPDSDEFVLTEVLRRGLDDWADAADVVDVLFNYAHVTDPIVGRRVALRIIPTIIERGLMNAGTIKADGFEPYTKEVALELLERRWPTDHFPELGEMPFWLDLTDTGKQWLQSRGLTWD